MNNDKIVKVTNRSGGSVCYSIPEKHLNRIFHAHETKSISVGELAEVAIQPGGRELLYNFLFIQDAEALKYALNVNEAPEYWLSEEDVPNWMVACSLDELKDGLDFAPEGIKDLIKNYAVQLPLNDMSKRQAIKDMLHFDVTKAIELQEATKEDEKVANKESAEAPSGKRRSSANTVNNITNSTSATATSNYKVINRSE